MEVNGYIVRAYIRRDGVNVFFHDDVDLTDEQIGQYIYKTWKHAIEQYGYVNVKCLGVEVLADLVSVHFDCLSGKFYTDGSVKFSSGHPLFACTDFELNGNRISEYESDGYTVVIDNPYGVFATLDEIHECVTKQDISIVIVTNNGDGLKVSKLR